jgi:hypothetical protein
MRATWHALKVEASRKPIALRTVMIERSLLLLSPKVFRNSKVTLCGTPADRIFCRKRTRFLGTVTYTSGSAMMSPLQGSGLNVITPKGASTGSAVPDVALEEWSVHGTVENQVTSPEAIQSHSVGVLGL